MAFIPINLAGSVGLVKDVEPHMLAPNIWSDMQNVRVNDKSVQMFLGHQSALGTPGVPPYAAFFVPTDNTKYWVYGGIQKIYVYDEVRHLSITSGTAVTSTGTLVSSGTTVTGTGTQFVVDGVAQGDVITTSDGQQQVVDTITSDTVLDTYVAFSPVLSAATFDIVTENVYAMATDRIWNGGILSGILVMNNGVDDPVYWANPDSFQRMQTLTAWPANTKARVVRPFKAFLVALDINKSGTRYPYMVKWSSIADPGAIPGSWDETDSTKLTGEFDLGQDSGYLIDCLPLRDINIIYKEGTTWGMQYIGYPLVFRFYQILKSSGMFAQNCAVEFKPGLHAVLTRDDFIVHDGQTSESKIDTKLRDYLFGLIDPDNWKMTHVAVDHMFNEVWICIPEVDESACTLAFVWNYREDTWGIRELPNSRMMPLGVVNPPVDDTWDGGLDDSWDTGLDIPWNQARAKPTDYRPVLVSPVEDDFFTADDGETFDGGTIQVVIERTGLGVESVRPDGSLTINLESWKFVRGIRPRINRVASGTTITIYLGMQDYLNAEVRWSTGHTFDPETMYKVDETMSGRLTAIRFEATGYFELDGYDLDITHDALY